KNNKNIPAFIDLSYLDELADGDNKFKEEIISHFIEHTPYTIKQMRINLSTKKFDALYGNIHKLIPQFTFVGLKTVIADSEYIELMSKNKKESKKLSDKIDIIEKKINKGIRELKKIINIVN
ncbi:MAG: hypothetical protein HGB12_06010, partial [Bacteroidetes bacterium]|nr:hypothetical protein [Bacteroidota bacterium]